MTAQEWIDRYVAEVGRMLPERQRTDVEREIRSLLQDAMEGEAAGGEPTDEQALAVLRQFGPPGAPMAAVARPGGRLGQF